MIFIAIPFKMLLQMEYTQIEIEREREWAKKSLSVASYCPSGAFARFCCWTLYCNRNQKLMFLLVFSTLLFFFTITSNESSAVVLFLWKTKEKEILNKQMNEQKREHIFMMFVARKILWKFQVSKLKKHL